MKQLTPMGLVKILAQVTAVMVIPMVGGAVAGILIDKAQGTSPLFVVLVCSSVRQCPPSGSGC